MTEVAAAVAVPKEKKARRSKFDDVYPAASTIKWNVDTNPKKAGSKSAERFQGYHGASTVGDFLAKGGTYQDLAYDIGRDFLRVTIVK